MSVRRVGGAVAGLLVGLAAGATLTLALQGSASLPEPPPVPSSPPTPFTVPEGPDTFLVWTSGGLPDGFGDTVRALPDIDRVVVVASDTAWLDSSTSAQGEVVDDPPAGYAIPLEVAAVNPREFEPFLPPADRASTLAIGDGQGILGETSAKLRGLGPGAVLRFGTVRIEVAAILPDELVGANELMVSREVGKQIGVTHDRYALLVPHRELARRQVMVRMKQILPAGLPVQVRAPGDTPYFRQGDAVLPQVVIKELFGEFAARPRPGAPGFLLLDPAWVRTHIVTQHVPILGDVTCNVALFPQIRGVMQELVDEGLEGTITSFSGCFAARNVNRIPTAGISHHSWGIALDINVPQNLFGHTPDQDPRLVAVFERWGFVWGGTFIQPDGMHFEYRRPPAED